MYANKKLLIVTHGIGDGGAQRVSVMLANGFSDLGYMVRIVTSSPTDKPYFLSRQVEYYPIDAVQARSYKRVIYRICSIKRHIEDFKPLYILSLSAIPNMMTIIARGFLEIPIVVSERTDPSSHPEQKLVKILRDILYRIPKKIVFQTEEAKLYFGKTGKRKGVVIPNAVAPSVQTKEPYRGRRRKIIVGFGSLSDQKDWLTAIKAFEIFAEKNFEYKFIIYGEGAERKILESYITNSIILRKRVELPGFVSDIHDKIIDAEMFVSSSRYDGISNSILEALALGLPCICTNAPVGGAKMLIRDGENGFLVNVGDYVSMSEKMKRISDNPDLGRQLGKEAIKVRERFQFDRIIKLWEKTILE